MPPDGAAVLVRNPNAGGRKKSGEARNIALRLGYDIRDSRSRGEVVTLAESAAREGASVIVACGGDGTLNEVVTGVDAADALDRVRLGVIPTGTGNNFATNVGIRSVAHAFFVIEHGEERTLDIGMADERPFVNSCIGGVPADASARTTPVMKSYFGIAAYLLSNLRGIRDFDALRFDIRAGSQADPMWSGEAIMLLIGNGRRFPGDRNQQANIEDGLLDVVIVERTPSLEYLSTVASGIFLRREFESVIRLTVPQLSVHHAGLAQFSLDGEMIRRTAMNVRCRPNAMRFFVGDTYDPNPDEGQQKPDDVP